MAILDLLTKRVQRGLYDIIGDQTRPRAADDESGSLFGPQRNRADSFADTLLTLLLLLSVCIILAGRRRRRLTGHEKHL